MQDQNFLSLKLPILLDSSSKELKKACSHTKMQPVARKLFARWPNLREAAKRLTAFLTVHWPDPRKSGESLLINCLESALTDAKLLEEEIDDIAVQKQFIRKVSEELLQCLSFTLMVKNKGVWSVYEMNTGVFLDNILQSSTSEELVWVVQPNIAHGSPKSKLICAAKVFTISELLLAGLLD